MRLNQDYFILLKAFYEKIKPLILLRLSEFKMKFELADDKEVFKELIFCTLTPQSKASVCLEILLKYGNFIIITDSAYKIAQKLKGVRFRNNKAEYIVFNKKVAFSIKSGFKNKIVSFKENIQSLRNWIVKSFKGIGLKEASHFIRNIGFGDEIAILDRHILNCLKQLGLIYEIPGSLNYKKYIEIESVMKKFSKEVKIPMAHLDLLMWHSKAGEILK